MNKRPEILVIIVTWNQKKFVLSLLASVEKLAYPADRLDIVVVDNASKDGTVEAIREGFPKVRLLVNKENLGGCGGFNTGLDWAFDRPETAYDYLWLLDNDVRVQEHALAELVDLLETHQDVAVAGSTMMQLTWPWRINEMGAFVDRGGCRLFLHRHREDVIGFRDKNLDELLRGRWDISLFLEHCRPWMDVDYVAAASLLVRFPVARAAGLWDDYFIHFDDVEWCLRIARMGYRIAVSAKSLIWHLSAEKKVPTWILYYDNRNSLYMVQRYGGEAAARRLRNRVAKKSFYYSLLGKKDIAGLLVTAVHDFDAEVKGKKTITLDPCYHDHEHLWESISAPEVRRILIPWTVNLQSVDLQGVIVRLMKQRPEVQVDYLVPLHEDEDGILIRQIPGAVPLYSPAGRLRRYLWYIRRMNSYDIVFQSDYHPLLSLTRMGKKTVFVNDETMNLRTPPSWRVVLRDLFHCVALQYRSGGTSL